MLCCYEFKQLLKVFDDESSSDCCRFHRLKGDSMLIIAKWIDSLNHLIGDIFKWAIPVIVIVCALVAVLRYGFDLGFAWLSEIYIWLNGAAFMLCSAYLLSKDKHVRVDFWYGSLSDRGKAIINLLGTLILLWPMLFVIAHKSLPGIQRSWRIMERSATLDGLPFLYVLKTCLIIFCFLLILQGLSLIIRSVYIILDSSKVVKKNG